MLGVWIENRLCHYATTVVSLKVPKLRLYDLVPWVRRNLPLHGMATEARNTKGEFPKTWYSNCGGMVVADDVLGVRIGISRRIRFHRSSWFHHHAKTRIKTQTLPSNKISLFLL